jgi:hypothetical protein
MSPPYFNTMTGAPSEAADYSEATDDSAPSPDEPTPAAPTPTDTGPTITRDRVVQETVSIATLTPEDALAAWDRMRDAWLKDPQLGDDRTPEGRAFHARRDALIMRAKGLAPEENRVIGTMHGDRMRPQEAEAPGTYEELPAAGVMADRPEQDMLMSVARNLGGESVQLCRDFLYATSRLFASGPPPNDLTLEQQYTARWPALATRQAIDGRLTDLHAALDRMLAEEGIGSAQREKWSGVLARVESYGLLERFAQSLWDRGPEAWVQAYALVQSEDLEAQQLRAAKARHDAAAEGDEARAELWAATEQAHARWKRIER